MKKYVVLLGILLFPTLTYANSLAAVTAYATGVGTYGDGSVYVFFDRQISSCSTAGRIDLSVDHPAKTQVLSIAMTAFTSGKGVRIHPGSCGVSGPVFGTAKDSYFYLTKDTPI